jgi:hypothetical protein
MDAPTRGFVTETRATNWEESLVSGNGSIGALVLGDPAEEVVTFSHERLFLPTTTALPPIEMAPYLPQIRALLFAGQYQQAADLAVRLADEHGYGGFRWTDPFVPAFDLRISQTTHGAPRSYSRGTDFETGQVCVSWHDDLGVTSRRLFVSRADDVAVLKLVPAGPGTLDCAVRISSPPGPREMDPTNGSFLSEIAEIQRQRLGLVLGRRVIFKRQHDRGVLGYQTAVRVIVDGGRVVPGEGQISITGADTVLVLVALETLTKAMSPTFPDLAARLNGLDADYDTLLLRHAAVHGALFCRARLDLGGKELAGLRSEELLERSRTGVAEAALLEKLFDAGRYAIISSCGALPPNLQGVWTGSYTPVWSCDYTHNGNVQTALAAILSTGTPELLLSYFSLLESMLADFRENGRALFGCRGVYVPSRFSTHGLQNHFNEEWCHEFWTAGAGWAARLFYDYWQYTGDDVFLIGHALPFMEEVADFYQDFLIEDDAGTLVLAPSLSPENHPANSASQAAINATMDLAVARDVLRNLIVASTELNINADRVESWEALLHRLPPYAVDEDGALAEWAWPALHNNQAHRHASHLYPLLYEVDPELQCDKRMLQACRRAVELRLRWRRQSGNGEMAFGVAWLGLAAAHLGMADAALEALTILATRYWRPSLVSTHDSSASAGGEGALFNVDICGGLPALIVEMLVQSSIGTISLLPACPVEWKTGCIEGVACRGQIVVELLRWAPGNVKAVLRSLKEVSLEIVLPARPKALSIDGHLVEDDDVRNDQRVRLTLETGILKTLEAMIDERHRVRDA